MKKTIQNQLTYFIGAWFALAIPAFAADKPSIGFVDISAIMQTSKQVKEAEDRLEDEFSGELDEIAEIEAKISSLERKLRKSGRKMKESEVKKAKREILSGKRDLKDRNDELQEEFTSRRREEFSKMQNLITAVVESVAKRKGVDLVVSGPVLYASDRVDLTEDVLKALDRRSQ